MTVDVESLLPGDMVVLAHDKEMLPRMWFDEPEVGVSKARLRCASLRDGSLGILLHRSLRSERYWLVLSGQMLGWLHDDWFGSVERAGELCRVRHWAG